MQDLNWDDFRLLLALSRRNSLAAAAGQLHLDETTLSRRLRALETQIGAPLLTRHTKTGTRLTELGARLAIRAEEMEAAVKAIPEDQTQIAGRITGQIRLTAVPWMIQHLLIPALPTFRHRHPDLQITLLSTSRNLDLTANEADLALRLARPKTGGTRLSCQKLATLDHALYAARNLPDPAPWIGYSDSAATPLPHQAWITRTAGPTPPDIYVSDAAAAAQAVASGLGQTLLPCSLGTLSPNIENRPATPAPPSRELWLIGQSAQSNYARIRAVTDWLRYIEWNGPSR